MPTRHPLEQVDRTPDGALEFAGFRGRLEEIGLPSLLSILEGERRTGILVLHILPGRKKARLYLRKGRVLRARLDRSEAPRDAELVCGLIASSHGTFDFRPSSVTLGDDIRRSTSQLLLEGAHRLNEARPAAQDDSMEWLAPVHFIHRWLSARAAVTVFFVAVVVMGVITVVLFSDQRAPGSPSSLPAASLTHQVSTSR